MPQPSNSPIRIQLGLRGWAAIAAVLAILIAVTIAIAFLAIGFFVFVLPVMLLAPLFYYFIPKPKPTFDSISALEKEELNRLTTIDGTFHVTESKSPEKTSGPSDDE